jgi:hypothetical protein
VTRAEKKPKIVTGEAKAKAFEESVRALQQEKEAQAADLHKLQREKKEQAATLEALEGSVRELSLSKKNLERDQRAALDWMPHMLQGFFDKDKARFLETLRTTTRSTLGTDKSDIALDVMRTLPEALQRDTDVLHICLLSDLEEPKEFGRKYLTDEQRVDADWASTLVYETECWWAAYAFDDDVQADPRVLVANWYVDSPETHMENNDDFAAMVKCPKLSTVAVVEISELMRCGHLDASDIIPKALVYALDLDQNQTVQMFRRVATELEGDIEDVKEWLITAIDVKQAPLCPTYKKPIDIAYGQTTAAMIERAFAQFCEETL